ncbi:adenylyltransferase/sulfurtransferase [Deinobacterium chartae]|uniref:Adenylyltransferase/sulfurtransferase n=1 Tax=Deinobacterium chartae TaxID=521158 RepID=A0A841HW93_9DEIO|nr:adenylyltransferase/sulfurtransferase [Deinobacterium chartae]
MLSRNEIGRYSRQLLLPGWDRAVQERLLEARVLVVGSGGLGTPVLTYLAGAGVGHLGLCEFDTVSLSNLQRQTLFATHDVGRPKAEVAAARLQQLNPYTRVLRLGRLEAQRSAALVQDFDLVLDCSDNAEARYLVSDSCAALGRSWVWGAAEGFEGMVSTFDADFTLRDLFPQLEEVRADCDTVGVVGPLLGVVGSTMALEALRLLTGLGESLRGRLWTYDALSGEARTLRLR